MRTLFLLSAISVFSFLPAFSQYEQTPISEIGKKDTFSLYAPTFDRLFFSQYYPESGQVQVQHKMNSQFFIENTDFPRYQTSIFLNNSHHYYSDGTFTFWQNDKPFALGARLNLKNTMGWEKLDLFFDANGQMVNPYDINELGHFIPAEGIDMFWEIGGGVSYEFAPRKTIFMKSSALFLNKKFIGSNHVGGINVRF